MIEQFTIFKKSGIVLWTKEPLDIYGEPVNELIQKVLLEGRASDAQFDHDCFRVKWKFFNELDLVFVAVYQKLLQLSYVDELLIRVQNKFIGQYGKNVQSAVDCLDFSVEYNKVLEEVEMSQLQRRPRKMRGFQKKSDGKIRRGADANVQKRLTKAEKKKEKQIAAGLYQSPAVAVDENEVPENAALNIQRGRRRMMRKFQKKKKDKEVTNEGKKKGKKMTTWNDSLSLDKKISKSQMQKLDKSASDTRGMEAGEAEEKVDLGESMVDVDEYDGGDDDSEDSSLWGFGSTMNFLKGLTGNKQLKRSDLNDALQSMEAQLISKNVARNIASDLCESVATTLVGQKIGTWTSLQKMVKDALSEAVTRVLTPKKSVDVLRSALEAKAKGRPFSIVFIGVNGVGKSTSLSKVCYYLLQKQLSVTIAACDTFRSGAVEQLKIHGRRLGVDIFERGYAKDPAHVATSALREAQRAGTDVVLIDTAGRMQNNTKLMKSLAKLVHDSKPDLVLFVGEALVGNDGVDQLKFFNQALEDNSPGENPRLIDGIVLTKFDTIDDNVGAALSMVYETGQPIIFVGTGQKYTHLRRLNVQTVVRALFR
eukprot:g2059.t1